MKRLYIVFLCQILALILFLSAHFLTSIYYYSNAYYVFFYMDLALFLAIGLQILSTLFIISLIEVKGR